MPKNLLSSVESTANKVNTCKKLSGQKFVAFSRQHLLKLLQTENSVLEICCLQQKALLIKLMYAKKKLLARNLLSLVDSTFNEVNLCEKI